MGKRGAISKALMLMSLSALMTFFFAASTHALTFTNEAYYGETYWHPPGTHYWMPDGSGSPFSSSYDTFTVSNNLDFNNDGLVNFNLKTTSTIDTGNSAGSISTSWLLGEESGGEVLDVTNLQTLNLKVDYEYWIRGLSYCTLWAQFPYVSDSESAFFTAWFAGTSTLELYTPAPVPEPTTFFLLVGGVAGLLFWRRKHL